VPDGWTWLIVATLPTVAIELFLLRSLRRTWPSGGGRAAQADTAEEVVRGPTEPGASVLQSAPAGGARETPTVEWPPLCSTDAVLCFEPGGQCTAANHAGSRLLPPREEGSTLSRLLAEGQPAAASLLAAVAAQGTMDRDESIGSVPASSRMHLTALALRDRDDNFWGAALFLHPSDGT
jgi:hypothetical protein